MVTARINTPGVIGKVAVRPAQRTTIADPTFKPKPNVAINEIQGVNVETKQDGDVLTYDAATQTYKSSPISSASISVTSVNGGSF